MDDHTKDSKKSPTYQFRLLASGIINVYCGNLKKKFKSKKCRLERKRSNWLIHQLVVNVFNQCWCVGMFKWKCFHCKQVEKYLSNAWRLAQFFFAFTHISPRPKMKSKQWKVLATIGERNTKETMKELQYHLIHYFYKCY
jgi:hypothetical protein